MPEHPHNAESPDPLSWLEEHGHALLAFALNRIADRQMAEDLVQETFVAAVKAKQQFRGQSTIKTWLTSILRHKIIDHQRKQSRRPVTHTPDLPDLADQQLFNKQGIWKQDVPSWPGDPQATLESQEFWQIFARCREKLPAQLAEAFLLRDIDQINTEEICKQLQITPSNLSVRLYRARMLMRQCLEKNWFQNQ
ncbi:MAG: sigma-70 family RNA polymerase sigma factor [Pirellulaceae bacterium]